MNSTTIPEDIEAKFEAQPWYMHTMVSHSAQLLGVHDKGFSGSFSSTKQSEKDTKNIWMKILTVDEEDENGYRFLAFDPDDGFLWYQQATSMADVSSAVQVRNKILYVLIFTLEFQWYNRLAEELGNYLAKNGSTNSINQLNQFINQFNQGLFKQSINQSGSTSDHSKQTVNRSINRSINMQTFI